MGVGREDSDCRFPHDRLVHQARIGKDEYVNGDNLPLYHINALQAAMWLDYTDENGNLRSYDVLCLSEPDAIFLKPIPTHCGGLMATCSGGNSPGFLGSFFCHGPWVFDRHTAFKAIEFGKRMIARGLIEKGFPDRFWGLFCDLYGVQFTPFGPGTYSQNRLDRPEYIEGARKAVKSGAFYLHGLKTQEELTAVTV